MFVFNKKKKSNYNLKPDFFYCLFEINDYFDNLLSKQNFITLSNYVKEHLIYQLSIKIKDEFLSSILVHEFEISKRANVLEKSNPLLSFVQITNTYEWKKYLFKKYKSLEQRITILINNLSEYILFFLEKLINDKDNLIENFNISFEIEDIILYQGDFHKNGKFVIRIEFSSNKVLFFKPRDSYNELFFKNIISFFESKTYIYIDFPNILSYDEYSWMSKLAYSNDFINNKEVKQYYENLGKLICVFHMLGTSDIIPDNLIITNNKIGLFDLEILTTKSLLKKNKSIRWKFSESVKRIGAIPEWMVADIDLNSVVLSSLFFCLNTQFVKSYVWDKNEFKFNIKDIPFSVNEDMHIPKINNEFIELNSEFLPFLIKGFCIQYDYILKNKESIKNIILQNFPLLRKLRVLFHATNIYSQVRTESLVPESYKEDKHIYEIIKEFVSHFYTDGYNVDKEILCQSIHNQLVSFDIPYFYFNLSNKKLMDGHEKTLSDWDFSPLDTIINRIDNFSEDDLNLQLRIINLSCSFAFDYFNNTIENSSIDKLPIVNKQRKDISKERYLEAAIKVGDYLIKNAITEKNEINWVSKVRETNGLYSISLLNYDLYDGLSGICLFYIQLYRITKKYKYKKTFEKIYNELKLTIQNQQNSNYYYNLPKEIEENYPISPYTFPTSFIYLTLQDEDLKTKENWIIIGSIIDNLSTLTTKTNQNDYLLGKFGLLDFLISTKKDFPAALLDKAESLIHILKKEIFKSAEHKEDQMYWPMYDGNKTKESGGFAHGSSSTSYVLSKLSKSNKKILESSILSLNHDRSFFNTEIRGWIDNREESNTYNDPVSWCHGSSGIILGRLLMEEFYTDSSFINEYEIAKKNIIEKGLHANECVCHGSLGNMEILFALSTRVEDIDTKNNIVHYLNILSEKIIDNISVIRNGVEGDTEILGLFTGLTGTAYQLLRFYDWENTPSILCLETKNYLNKVLHEC